MLDNILSNLKKGAERAKTKGEEVAHAARLKVEVFQLGRELDGHYGRLGRSYHSGAETGVLEGIQADIRRVEEEISSRERLITELGGDPSTLLTDDEAPAAPTPMAASPATFSPASSSSVTSSPVTPSTAAQTPSPATPSHLPDPTVAHSDLKIPPQGPTASMGNEPGRDAVRHENTVGQAATMKGHGDPLDK